MTSNKNSSKLKFRKSIKELKDIFSKLKFFESNIDKIIDVFFKTLSNNGKIFICGNGGSAAEAEHLSTEFLVRLRPKINRRSFPIINLGMNTSYLTACANDYDFDDVFKRSLSSLVDKGDLLWCLSTSGKSKNILKVLKYAKQNQIQTIGFLGNNGGEAKKYVDLKIIVPSKNTARIQEIHQFIGHFILEQTENLLIKNYRNKKLI